MYCPEHRTYTALRIPRNQCHACWRLYTEKHGVSIEEILKRPYISEARASWLRDNYDDIIYAELEHEKIEAPPPMVERATATIISQAELVEPEDEEEDESKPAKGIRV